MIGLQDLQLRKPIAGESLDGYLAQMTSDNDLYRVEHISSVAGLTHAHRPTVATMGWRGLPALASLLEVDVEELRLRSYPPDEEDGSRRAFFGTTVHKVDLRHRARFFAPSALRDSPHHRAIWQLRLPYDPETGELLVSKCQRAWCGRVQRWRHSAGVRYCDGCVSDLAEQQVPRLVDDTLAGYRLAVGLTHSDPAAREKSLRLLPAEIASLGPAVAYELLLRLVPVANPICTWTSAARIWHNEPEEIAAGMSGAWDILRGWPGTMTERFNRDIATSETRHGDGNGGATLRFLKTQQLAYLPEPLRQVIRRFHQSIDTAGPNGAALRNVTMTSVEASKFIGLGTSIIVGLRRAGAFRTIGVARGPLLVPVFDRAEVSQVRTDMGRRLDLNRCSESLGVPYYAVEQLAALGRLPLLVHQYFHQRYRYPQTTRQAYEDLRSRLIDGLPTDLDGAEPIYDLMHMVGMRLKPWDVVIDAMLERQLDYAVSEGTKPLFQRISVRRDDIVPLLRHPIARGASSSPLADKIDADFPFIDKISKRDAAEVLNLAVRQSTELLKAYPTAPEPVIPLEHVLLLARQFVTNTEIAAKLGVPHQTVRAGARELGCERQGEAGYLRTREAELITAAIASAERRKLPISPIRDVPA